MSERMSWYVTACTQYFCVCQHRSSLLVCFISGVCDCTDFTAGLFCERCQDGYYGNALNGSPGDCSPCLCPDRTTCSQVPDTGDVVCTNCPTGQRGQSQTLCLTFTWFWNTKPQSNYKWIFSQVFGVNCVRMVSMAILWAGAAKFGRVWGVSVTGTWIPMRWVCVIIWPDAVWSVWDIRLEIIVKNAERVTMETLWIMHSDQRKSVNVSVWRGLFKKSFGYYIALRGCVL